MSYMNKNSKKTEISDKIIYGIIIFIIAWIVGFLGMYKYYKSLYDKESSTEKKEKYKNKSDIFYVLGIIPIIIMVLAGGSAVFIMPR